MTNRGQNVPMERKPPANACCRCGATAYRPVITRDATGAMKASHVYRCVGCKLEFTNIDTWRGTPPAEVAPPQSVVAPNHSAEA